MGLRGPKPVFTAEQRLQRRKERNRARYWVKRGLPVPARATEEALEIGRREQRKRDYKARVLRTREFVHDYKRTHPCVDCGYDKDIRALQFDHRERGTKRYGIAQMMGGPLRRVQAEIAKCDVRCANCHAIRTQAEQHWREVEDWERVSKN